MTPFQQQVLFAINALGCKATQGNIAKRLKKPVGTVSSVLWRYMRPAKTAEAVDWNVTGKNRVWRSVK